MNVDSVLASPLLCWGGGRGGGGVNVEVERHLPLDPDPLQQRGQPRPLHPAQARHLPLPVLVVSVLTVTLRSVTICSDVASLLLAAEVPLVPLRHDAHFPHHGLLPPDHHLKVELSKKLPENVHYKKGLLFVESA